MSRKTTFLLAFMVALIGLLVARYLPSHLPTSKPEKELGLVELREAWKQPVLGVANPQDERGIVWIHPVAPGDLLREYVGRDARSKTWFVLEEFVSIATAQAALDNRKFAGTPPIPPRYFPAISGRYILISGDKRTLAKLLPVVSKFE
jgi:hypothetical protein